MARRRRKNNDFFNVLFYFLALGGLLIFQRTRNLVDGVSFIVIGILVVSFIIIAIRLFQRKRKKEMLLNSGIDIIDRMSGFDFEKLVLVHFEKLGYKGEVTRATNDYGADLILQKDGEKIVVQAKRWRDKVGIKAIQEVVGAINYYKANKGMVITNSYFTPNAKELAVSNNIDLWDRNVLVEVMAKNQGKEISEVIKSENSDDLYCPECNGELVKRKGRNGAFWGCSSYPKCRFTKNID